MKTTVNMSQSDGLSSEDTIVQDIMADTNIPLNLLWAAINNFNSRNNIMQSPQATPTSSSSLFTTKGQQSKVQTMTPPSQITALTANPNIPFNFRIKEIKGRIRRET